MNSQVLRRRALIAGALFAVPAAAGAQEELEPRSYAASPSRHELRRRDLFGLRGSVNLDGGAFRSATCAPRSTRRRSGFPRRSASSETPEAGASPSRTLGRTSRPTCCDRAATGSRYGFPDARVRLALNLIGKALTPRQFARRKPSTILGLSLSMTAPTRDVRPDAPHQHRFESLVVQARARARAAVRKVVRRRVGRRVGFQEQTATITGTACSPRIRSRFSKSTPATTSEPGAMARGRCELLRRRRHQRGRRRRQLNRWRIRATG